MRYFLLCYCFWIGSSGWAQTTPSPSLNVKVEPLYPQASEGWNPFLVELENIDAVHTYEGDFVLFNQLLSSSYYSETKQTEMLRSFQIAPKTKKRFWLYLDFADEIGKLAWKIHLKKPHVEEIKEILHTFPNRAGKEYQVLVLSKENNVFAHLNRLVSSQHARYYSRYRGGGYYSSSYGKTTFQIIQGESTRLPDRKEGYDPIHFVVLNNYPLESLTVAQQEALKQWIAEGGEILLSPGSEQWLLSNPIRELFPHEGVKTEERTPETPNSKGISLNKLEAFQGNNKNIPFLYFNLNYSKKTIFPFLQEEKPYSEEEEEVKTEEKKENGDVYLAYQPYYKGKVYFLPFDISRRPLKNWGERRFYDSFILSKRTELFGKNLDENRDAYELINQAKTIPFLHLFILLSFYLLLMGPANYYLLYRFRLQSYLLVSVTTISIFYLLIVFVYGYILNGVQNNYHLLTLIVGNKNYQNETSYLSLYSAKNSVYQLNTDQKNSSLRLLLFNRFSFPKHPISYTQNEGKFHLNLPIGLWTTRCFQIQTHHFQERPLPFQIQKRSLEQLEIKANIPIEEYYVFDSFQILAYSTQKIDSNSPALSISFKVQDPSAPLSFHEKKVLYFQKNQITKEDNSLKKIHEITNFARSQLPPHFSKICIVARLPKNYHQIFLNQNPLVSQKNEVYFIQEVLYD